jgi:hypothetical protein
LSADTDSRDRTTLRLLDRWPWEHGGVLIGGYAICAYGPPRYSIDVDVVIPIGAATKIRRWLRDEQFQLQKRSVPNPQNYEGQVERFGSGEVTLDLLAGAVRDREAQVDLPEPWISMHPRNVRLETLSGVSENLIPVARPESMWALKLQAGRDSDISDLFAICDQKVDLREVSGIFQQLRKDSLVRKLSAVRDRLEDPRLYVDSLSRRGLGKPTAPRNIRQWARFLEMIDRVVTGSIVVPGP